MKERPILFSGPMVKAILERRKTQTRRAVKPQPSIPLTSNDVTHDGRTSAQVAWEQLLEFCPYGVPGDLLWVRETFCHNPNGEPAYWYAADGIEPEACDADGVARYRKDGRPSSPWIPSIHMPRWASRITLEIEAVRVERLQEISDEDALKEGVNGDECTRFNSPFFADQPTPSMCYANLWQSINGTGSWEANPWVWVVQFRRMQ